MPASPTVPSTATTPAVQIGTVTVPNRFVVPPMGNNFANTDGTLVDTNNSTNDFEPAVAASLAK